MVNGILVLQGRDDRRIPVKPVFHVFLPHTPRYVAGLPHVFRFVGIDVQHLDVPLIATAHQFYRVFRGQTQ